MRSVEYDSETSTDSTCIRGRLGSRRLDAAEDLRRYLSITDWSDLTPRRRQILEAFVGLASEHGYESVTMRSLAGHVGLTAPGIYRHFPDGRDTIVTQAFRWHFYRFASAVLRAVDETHDADAFWDSLVSVHVRRQLEGVENDLWDILIANDRIAGFLPSETRVEYYRWLSLYDNLYAGAAHELGHTFAETETDKVVRVIVKTLDAANEWCNWDSTPQDLDRCVRDAVAVSRNLLQIDLTVSTARTT